jgi:hypothetical protein
MRLFKIVYTNLTGTVLEKKVRAVCKETATLKFQNNTAYNTIVSVEEV